ncbi:MAG: hypothetical protein HONBIEJF_00507 [Fimbriimonadaceae bacterium]|nr:hypothetical protein [Fimbriimonadaceae bacterium]
MARHVIQPNVHNRIQALDILRGFAVLGILLANIPAFSGPYWSAMASGQKHESIGLVEALTYVFVTGKFRTPLAIMFGVGLVLQYQRRIEIPRAWPWGYLKRNALLLVIGLLHVIFIWSGDILLTYAVVAFIAVWFAKLKDEVLMVLSIMGIVLITLAAAGFAYALTDPTFASMMGSESKWLTPAEEMRVFGAGTYIDQMLFRAKFAASLIVSSIVFAPAFVPYFLLGMWLGKIGFLASPSSHPKLKRWLLGLGLGLGLALNAMSFMSLGKPWSFAGYLYAEGVAGPILGIGYLTLAAVIVEETRNAVTGAIERVGRMALTAYLAQSVIATAIFYSGIGLFGKTSSSQDLLFVILIWAIVIAFCNFWMKRFSIGPVEWLWRSATEFRVLAIKVGPPTTVGGPPSTIESSASLPDSSARLDTDRPHADQSSS